MAHNDGIGLMAHLMRRAGFGAHPDELEKRLPDGYEQTVEELTDPDRFGIPRVDRDILYRFYPSLEMPGSPANGRSHFIYHMINSSRPLEEKMVLFWHMVFATGNSKIDNPPELMVQFDMFREYGMGSFRDLLVQLAQNPAMIFWLDNNENHRDAPNENWGRELLELFSMGVGNYTEKDVFECARAFTGWTMRHKIPRLPVGRFFWGFQYKPEDHDDGEKLFLGQRGRFNGEDIIDIVARQPATARFIARHLYNFFVADDVQVSAWQQTPHRDPVALNFIADAFVSSRYDIRSTLRALFNSDFFKSEQAWWAKVKSPAEVVAGTMRMVGDFQFPRPGLQPIGDEPGYQGQELINPPSVEGWHTGAEWIDSGSLVRRINFAADRFSNIELPGVASLINRVRARGRLSPEELVDLCVDLMGPMEVGEGTRRELLTQADLGGDLSWDTEHAAASASRVGDMLALIAASREFQFV